VLRATRHALRGFVRVSLTPHETRPITIALSPRDLSFVKAEGDRQLIPGAYRLTVGSGQPAAGIPGTYAPYTVRKKIDLPE
jgi:beta-glucosidase